MSVLQSNVAPISVSRKTKPHWYKIIIYECPVCGVGQTFRERQYTERPPDILNRYEYHHVYDQCSY